QVLLPTAFLVALWVGWAFEAARTGRAGGWTGLVAAVRATARRHRAAWSVGLLLLALATASTLASPSIRDSGPVWLHGVVEPMAFGLLVLALGPDLRRLALLALALGLSAALGGLINLGQTLPTVGSLLDLQGHARELFSRLTYFNVGLFGEILAMAIPLLVGALAGWRALRLGRVAVVVVTAGLAIALICLYLTFSKSGWLAAGVAVLVLLVALAPSIRWRVAFVAGAVAISVLAVPWPLVVLRPVAPSLADAYRGIVVAVQGEARAASWDPATAAGETSITERLFATRAALSMAVDHPLLGVGLNRFGTEYAGAYRPPDATAELDSAHDLLPNLAAELGLPAALLTAFAMAAGLWCCWRVWHRPSADGLARTLAASLGAALVGWWIVSATFDPDLYRAWRLMASDVVMAAVLVAMAAALVPAVLPSGVDGQPGRRDR
ncbi:MAG TPA: O-antigen ligase family protein, partial [Candidatus Limnocylindrales bacterium]|nr:O-antigen ligase family protein [Candidatus Limnocylindrales bacterium]